MKLRLLLPVIAAFGCGAGADGASLGARGNGFTLVEESILLEVLRSPLNPAMLDAVHIHGCVVMADSADYAISAREISDGWETHWGTRLTPITLVEWESNAGKFSTRRPLISTNVFEAEGIQIARDALDDLAKKHPESAIVVNYSTPVFMHGGSAAFVFVMLSPVGSFINWGGGQNLYLYRADEVSGVWAITAVFPVSIN